MRWLMLIMLVILFDRASSMAQVVAYEADGDFPDSTTPAWQRDLQCTPDRHLESGWLVENVQVGECPPPDTRDRDRYFRWLDDFVGVPAFFCEWRVYTTGGAAELDYSAPATMVLDGVPSRTGVGYHITIARDSVRYIRDAFTVYFFVDIEPNVPHVYRLELYGPALYIWTIDGIVMDCGVPRAGFPTDADEVVTFRTSAWEQSNVTYWDYVRYGVISAGLPGDLNCDGRVDNFDIDAFVLAISDAPRFATTYVGCNFRNADCNDDGRVNNFDVDAFVALLGG